MDSLYANLMNEVVFNDISTKLNLYMKENIINSKSTRTGIDYNVLVYWNINTPKFHVLSR